MAERSTAMKVQSALQTVGTDPIGEKPNTVAGEETDSLVTGLPVVMVGLLALAGVASGVCAMAFTVSSLVDVASICLFGLAPIAVYQKAQLHGLGGMRQQEKDLKTAAKETREEGEKLTKHVQELQAKVNDLRTIQAQLNDIAKKAGSDNVDRLIYIIQENRKVQERIKQNLEHSILQQVLQCALRSDTNNDFTLNKRELRHFELKLSNIPGVELDPENWKRYCQQEANHDEKEILVEEIMAMFRNLKNPNISPTEQIFRFVPDHFDEQKRQLQQKQKPIGFFGF